MATSSYQRLKELFDRASDLPRSEREALLTEVRADDPALADELVSLLAYDRDERGFLTPDDENDLDADGGQRIGPYRVLKEIGRGGMGVVYEARQHSPRRTVALKVLQASLLDDTGIRRFGREVDVLGRLQHPGIAQVYDANLKPGPDEQPYLVMERVEGRTILEWADAQGLDARQRLLLMVRVCDAVHHAHQRGVIHRDLKPGNILVDDSGQPKVLDFGIAMLADPDSQETLVTQVGQVVGTVGYMSPEQASGESTDLDVRTDVYSLGVLTFEVLAGRRPHELTDLKLHQALGEIVEGEPIELGAVVPDLRGDVATIVHKALEKDRERRYDSASQFADDLRRYLRDEPILARPASRTYQFKKFVRRHRFFVGGVAATLTALLIGLVSTILYAIEASENEAEARRQLYANRIGTTLAALDAHDARSARVALEAIEDPDEQQCWEYRHLQARLDAVLGRHVFASEVASTTGRSAITDDGSALVVEALHDALVVRDVISGEVVASFDVRDVRLPALSPDGALLAALVGEAGELTVWDVGETEPLFRRPVDGDESELLSFSGDGAILALVGLEVVIAIDPRTGNERWRAPLAELHIEEAAHIPAEVITAWSREERPRLAVVRVHPTNRSFDYVDASGSVESAPIVYGTRIALSPDGADLASNTDFNGEVVGIRQRLSHEVLHVLPGQSGGIRDLAYSPDGRRLATVTGDLVRIWDLETRTLVESLPLNCGSEASLIWRGDRLVVTDASQVQVFEPGSASSLRLVGHTSYVYMVAYSADGSLIASLDYERQVRLWDAVSGEALWHATHRGIAKGLGFDGEGRLSIAADHARTYDLATGRETPSGVVVSAKPFLERMRGGARFVAHSFKGESHVTSPDGSLLVEGREAEGRLVVTDLASGEVRLDVVAHDGAIYAAAVSPDNRHVVTGGEDQRLHLWELASGRRLASVSLPSQPYSAVFSSDGQRIATGDSGGRVRLWDVPRLEPVAQLEGHTSYVHSVAFSPDGSALVSGSGDFDLRLWDTVPRRERQRQVRASRALRDRMRAPVEALIAELGDAERVAERLRADADLDEDERRAALRVLLEQVGGETAGG